MHIVFIIIAAAENDLVSVAPYNRIQTHIPYLSSFFFFFTKKEFKQTHIYYLTKKNTHLIHPQIDTITLLILMSIFITGYER